MANQQALADAVEAIRVASRINNRTLRCAEIDTSCSNILDLIAAVRAEALAPMTDDEQGQLMDRAHGSALLGVTAYRRMRGAK